MTTARRLLAGLPAILAVVAVCLPWFRGRESSEFEEAVLYLDSDDDLYAWSGGALGLVAMVLVVAACALVVTRWRRAPVAAIVVALVAAGLLVVVWVRVPDVQLFSGGLTWDETIAAGEREGERIRLFRGTQLAYWLAAAAAVGGVLISAAGFVRRVPSPAAGPVSPARGR